MLEITKNHSGRFSPPAADKDTNFRICPLGSSGIAKYHCINGLSWTSASGNVEKDGGESE